MTPRAMCRIVMIALLVLGPLLTEWLSPSQVWGANWTTNSSALKSNIPISPGGEDKISPARPTGACNYFYSGTGQIEGIGGDSNPSTGGGTVENTVVEIIDAQTNQLLYRTQTVYQGSGDPGFIIPDTRPGAQNYYENFTASPDVPATLKFKIRYIPVNNSGPTMYYPDSPTLDGAATLAFDLSCHMINADTLVNLPNAGAALIIYGSGSIAGRVMIRYSGNPITTGVPISGVVVTAYPTNGGVPSSTPCQGTNNTPAQVPTNYIGNYLIDINNLTSCLGQSVFLKYTDSKGFITHWLSDYDIPGGSNGVVDADNPSTFPLSNYLVRVAITDTVNFSTPQGFPANSQIVATMLANNTVTGTVTKVDGVTKVPGAIARAYVNGVLASESAPADDNGLYTLTKISPFVHYTIKVTPPTGPSGQGLVGQWFNDTGQPAYLVSGASDVYVAGYNAVYAGRDVKLRPGQTISGKVTGTNFAGGVQNVEVSVYDASKPISLTSPLYQGTTDGSGNFSFTDDFDAGTYKVFYRPFGNPAGGAGNPQHTAGWFSNPFTADPTSASVKTISISVTNGGTFTCTPSCTADQNLPLGSIIFGTVTLSPTPASFSGQIKITVYDVSNGSIAQEFFPQVTLPTFSYNTSPLPDGNYRIQFTHIGSSGVAGYIGGYYLTGSSPNLTSVYTSSTVIGIIGGSSGPYAVTMQQGAALDVLVKSRSDTGVESAYPGVEVRITDPTNANIVRASINTDANGYAHFDSLRVQPYGIYIVPPGSGAPDFSVPVTPLVAGGTITVTRVITRSAFITGILKVTGNPTYNFGTLGNTPLTLEAFKISDGTSVPVFFTSLSPNQDGTFTYAAKLQGGNYRIKFTIPGYLPQYYLISYNRSNDSPVQVNVDQTFYNVSADFKPGGALRVRVVKDSDGTPVSGAKIELFNSNAALATPLASAGAMNTDSNGYVTHIPQLPGIYYFKVSEPQNNENLYQTIYYSKRLTITDAVGVPIVDNALQDVTIRVAPKGQISGTVRRIPPGGGFQIPTSFKVSAYDELTKELVTQVTVTGSANGTYTLSLPVGQYTIKFDDLEQFRSGYYDAQTTGGHNPVNVLPVTSGGTPNINFDFVVGACSVLPNYSIGPASTTAVSITYYTNCPGTTRVTYSLTPGGAGTSYPSNPSDNVLQHDVFVPGLQPNTTYFFKLFSTPSTSGYTTPELAYNGTTTPGPAATAVEIALRTSADGKAWYFAAGDTTNSATNKTTEVLHLLNHNSSDAQVRISYYGTSGLISSTTKTVLAQQRLNVTVSTDLAPLQVDHSTVVTVATGGPDISVERTIYTERTTGVGLTTNGGYTLQGSPGLSNNWYFPDVTNYLFTDNYFSIFNPNLVTGCININYYYNGTSNSKNGISVPPLSKLHIKVKDPNYQPASGILAQDFGVEIATTPVGCLSSDKATKVQLLVEQESYYSDISGMPRKGVSGKFGSTTPQSNWVFSDGLNPAVDYQRYVFLNTSFFPVTVTMTYQLERAPVSFNPVVTYTVPGKARLAVPITNPNLPQFGRVFGFTIQMQASGGIVVERNATYQLAPVTGFDGTFTEAGYWRNAKSWIFAGGDTLNGSGRSGDLSYVVVNPSISATANITLTYFYADGTAPISKTTQVAPNTRVSLPAGVTLNNNPGIGTDKIVGVRIDSDQDIAAERIYYWRFGNWVGGNATFGYIPPGY